VGLLPGELGLTGEGARSRVTPLFGPGGIILEGPKEFGGFGRWTFWYSLNHKPKFPIPRIELSGFFQNLNFGFKGGKF